MNTVPAGRYSETGVCKFTGTKTLDSPYPTHSTRYPLFT